MTSAADSFGSYGARGQLGLNVRAARAADRAVTLAIALVLALTCAVSGYAVWDAMNVLDGGSQLTKPTSYESFSELIAANPDVCAWLTIDNTNIDYPVVQGEDDFEYLTKDATGEYSAAGSIFLDAGCDRSFAGPYELLMGHHMQAGKMFGDLDNFLDQSFFEANSTGELMLPDRTYSLEVVAVLQADAYERAVYDVPKDASAVGELASFVATNAIFSRGALSGDDHVIALSTCSSSGATARTVLVCRVIGETEGFVDVGRAVE